MVKHIFGNCILALFMLSTLSSAAAVSSRKTDALDQKIIEISALRVKIIDKIDKGSRCESFFRSG